MSDPMNPSARNPSGAGTQNEPREAAQDLASTARETARGIREEATAAFEDVKAEGAAVVESAKQRAMEFADEQKEAGARQAEGIAGSIHRAAGELEDGAPWLARHVHAAAGTVETMARTLRERRPGDLLGDLQDLARRQPMAFFGAAALAGFAIARFLRSSAPHSSMHGERDTHVSRMSGRTTSHGERMPGGMAGDPSTGARPATMGAATLGGAAVHGGSGMADRTGMV